MKLMEITIIQPISHKIRNTRPEISHAFFERNMMTTSPPLLPYRIKLSLRLNPTPPITKITPVKITQTPSHASEISLLAGYTTYQPIYLAICSNHLTHHPTPLSARTQDDLQILGSRMAKAKVYSAGSWKRICRRPRAVDASRSYWEPAPRGAIGVHSCHALLFSLLRRK